MTNDRSLERAARSWIEAGPTLAPEHVVEAALQTIESTPQERDWIVPWRSLIVNGPLKYAAVAALGVLLILGAILVVRPPEQTVGVTYPSTGPSTPTVAPSLAPPPRSPIPRPSAVIDEAAALDVARRFQDLMNASRIEDAADLVWVGATIGGTPTFSRQDIVEILNVQCGAQYTATWPQRRNEVHWDMTLRGRPGYPCREDSQKVETTFLVENGLIVEYRPIFKRVSF
jgi:hypothetical protein